MIEFLHLVSITSVDEVLINFVAITCIFLQYAGLSYVFAMTWSFCEVISVPVIYCIPYELPHT